MISLLKFDPIPKSLHLILLLVVIILSAFFRLVNVNHIPPGLYQDESAIGYNAYTIAYNGTDEYGIKYPLYFKSFNDYKLPVYIYATAASIKVFGLNEFAVRFPSILAGILAVIVLFFLIRLLTRNYSLSLLSALVLCLNPSHLFFSRAGFEVNLALTLALAGTLFFILTINKNKFIYIIPSLIFFGLSLYSYNVTRLIVPVFLAGYILLYREKIIKFPRWQLISGVLLFLMIALPFLIGIFDTSGVLSARKTLLTSTDILAKELEFRSYIASLPHWYISLFYNRYIYMSFQYLQNIGSILSGSFYFVTGTEQQNQGIGNVGYFYLFDLPFFIWGLVTYFKLKMKEYKIFLFWIITSILVLALSKQVPQATRGFFILMPGVVFIALGFYSFIFWLSNYKQKLLKYFLVSSLLFFIFFNLQYYFLSYYMRFPYSNGDAWRTVDRDLSLYLKNNEKKYTSIVIDRDADFVYTTALFYEAVDPQEFIKTAVRQKDGDLIKTVSWGKYVIRQIDWNNDSQISKILIVSTEANVPPGITPIKIFRHPAARSVISIHDTIVNSPQDGVKYVLFESKK